MEKLTIFSDEKKFCHCNLNGSDYSVSVIRVFDQNGVIGSMEYPMVFKTPVVIEAPSFRCIEDRDFTGGAFLQLMFENECFIYLPAGLMRMSAPWYEREGLQIKAYWSVEGLGRISKKVKDLYHNVAPHMWAAESALSDLCKIVQNPLDRCSADMDELDGTLHRLHTAYQSAYDCLQQPYTAEDYVRDMSAGDSLRNAFKATLRAIMRAGFTLHVSAGANGRESRLELDSKTAYGTALNITMDIGNLRACTLDAILNTLRSYHRGLTANIAYMRADPSCQLMQPEIEALSEWLVVFDWSVKEMLDMLNTFAKKFKRKSFKKAGASFAELLQELNMEEEMQFQCCQ